VNAVESLQKPKEKGVLRVRNVPDARPHPAPFGPILGPASHLAFIITSDFDIGHSIEFSLHGRIDKINSQTRERRDLLVQKTTLKKSAKKPFVCRPFPLLCIEGKNNSAHDVVEPFPKTALKRHQRCLASSFDFPVRVTNAYMSPIPSIPGAYQVYAQAEPHGSGKVHRSDVGRSKVGKKFQVLRLRPFFSKHQLAKLSHISPVRK
jgi:hypothetical protein